MLIFPPQITAFCVLPMTWQLWTLSAALIVAGFITFFLVSRAGAALMEREVARQEEEAKARDKAGDDREGRKEGVQEKRVDDVITVQCLLYALVRIGIQTF